MGPEVAHIYRGMKALIALLLATSFSHQGFAQRKCAVSGEPLLWIMRACALESGTDAEIAVQGTACFRAANSDLTREKCSITEKYKGRVCEFLQRTQPKHASVPDCLGDPSVKPFMISE